MLTESAPAPLRAMPALPIPTAKVAAIAVDSMLAVSVASIDELLEK